MCRKSSCIDITMQHIFESHKFVGVQYMQIHSLITVGWIRPWHVTPVTRIIKSQKCGVAIHNLPSLQANLGARTSHWSIYCNSSVWPFVDLHKTTQLLNRIPGSFILGNWLKYVEPFQFWLKFGRNSWGCGKTYTCISLHTLSITHV